MDFRKTFDRIPVEFDKNRPRYREEVFRELASVCKLGLDKKVLEIGPGTGQARPGHRARCENRVRLYGR